MYILIVKNIVFGNCGCRSLLRQIGVDENKSRIVAFSRSVGDGSDGRLSGIGRRTDERELGRQSMSCFFQFVRVGSSIVQFLRDP